MSAQPDCSMMSCRKLSIFGHTRSRKATINHVEVDIAMINHADEVWVVSQYGKDCSWEIGYACGKNIPVIMWRDATNAAAIEADWMIYHGVNSGIIAICDIPSVRYDKLVHALTA